MSGRPATLNGPRQSATGPPGATAIVAALAAAGTRMMFGVPGGGPNLDVVGAADDPTSPRDDPTPPAGDLTPLAAALRQGRRPVLLLGAHVLAHTAAIRPAAGFPRCILTGPAASCRIPRPRPAAW